MNYKKSVEEIYRELNTSINGLTQEEAIIRLDKYGENKLKEGKKKSAFVMFLSQFNDFMIILLIFASIFSFVISYIRGESYVDSIIIIIIVIVNAILSFIQERKAEESISELNKMFVTNNYVIRDGVKRLTDGREIVPGDIIELEAGDYVSADARIISSDNLIVNESTLTGESLGVKKESINIDSDKELYERVNMVYAGCNVMNGHSFVVVTETGMNTELGLIADSLMNKKSGLTPLQKKVNQISKVLTYLILGIIIVMMGIGIYLKNDFFDVLMLSISLAVAAIPEGMSSVITIILSLGISDMAKKNVIIRKMSSVETLGSTDVICSDKTGTITQNKMEVKCIWVNGKLYSEKDNILNSEMLFRCAYFCHNVVKSSESYIGDETEISIFKFLESINFGSKGERIREVPFDSDRKMMSTINRIDDVVYSFTKGSLDSVINNCKFYLLNGNVYEMTDDFRNMVYEAQEEESKKSLRLLAFAYKDSDVDDPERNMIFAGLMGMMDPPRETVPAAIYTCLKAGIKPIMITGDSMTTAGAIAKSVGIIGENDDALVTEGKSLDVMSDSELKERVNDFRVYARVSPNCKLRIVEALQSNGYVVAMTGDGVNDAPAIQKADIGIGMGITGTEVVKKVADCILVDDSFSTIVDGVYEGRRITSNIKKIILYLLAGNIVEVILVFVSMVLNMEIFTTLQLLWINLITDSIPAIMLAFEKGGKDIMDNTLTNRYNDSFFTPFLSAKIFIGAVIKSIVMLVLFMYFAKTADVGVAGSLMFIYLTIHELLFAYSCKNPKKCVIGKLMFNNKKLNMGMLGIVIVNLIVLVTPLSKFFIVSNIGFGNVMIVIIVSVFMFILGEFAKPIYVKFFKDYGKGGKN